MKFILIIVGIILIISVLIILIRTLKFKPMKLENSNFLDITIDDKKAAEHLSQMIRCKTISRYETELIDEKEFEKFRVLLQKLYPNIYEKCSYERIGKSGILIRWQGKQTTRPSVLMAHYDVVPVSEEKWEKPPFEGIIEDGVLWGRGTLDTKGTLCGIMEAIELLTERSYIPENDIYISFAGDEEVNGEATPSIVKVLKERGIKPALVLDEGGAVVKGVFPGVSKPCALIGIGEKGFMNLVITTKGKGGHASTPPPHTIVGKLSKAIVEIEKHPFKARLTKPAKEMFDTLGRHSTFIYKIIFANLWCFKPLLDILCKKTGGELNALMRTTCAATMMEAGKAPNVLASEGKIIANMRLHGEDTPKTAIEYLKSIVKEEEIEFSVMEGSMNPSPYSETSGESWEKLKKAIMETWTDTIVSPYLMVACSDSRHYCEISDHVYRFSAMELSKEERGMIHGHNERIPVDKIATTIKFYIRLIKQL
jgi:carboxypeptidase PM20D1